MEPSVSGKTPVLILGIGNILMGDEGVGCRVAQYIQSRHLPEGIACLDGGTGSFHLLAAMQQAGHVVLIDATADGNPPGTVTRLTPRFSADYPRTLTAHDIGLKDLLDAFHLLNQQPAVTLFAVSIKPPQEMSTTLSPVIEQKVPEIAAVVLQEAQHLLASH